MFNLKLKKSSVDESITDLNEKTIENPDNIENCEDKLNFLTNNQRKIVEKLDKKIIETDSVTELLIKITKDISNYVDVEMESISKVVGEISNYSAIAEEVFSSTENSKQISQNTMEVAKSGTKDVLNSIQAMKDIETSMLHSKDVVENLSNKAVDINNMLDVIKDISNNTNLLSLNASIEAARAGEAGRGFAVVAKEVKKLAERSMDSVSFISNNIKEIHHSVNEAIDSINKTMDKVKEGTEIANVNMDAFNNIISSIETSTNVSEEINDAISKQVKHLENVILSTDEMSSTSEKLKFIVELASLNTQYTRTSLKGLSQVAENLKHISNSVISKISTSSDENITLNTFINGKVAYLDPAVSYEFDSSFLLNNVHTGLLTINSFGEISPGIAKSWYLENDNLTWVFNIKKGIKFHNGSEVTAEDVKFSLERLLDPKIKSPNSWLLEIVKGASDFQKGIEREVSGIKVLDKYRVSISLSYCYSGFLLNIALDFCSIINKVSMLKGNVVGCGPYIIDQFNDNNCILKSFKDYFNGAAYIDTINIKFKTKNPIEDFLNDNLDLLSLNSGEECETLAKNKDSKIINQDLMTTYYASFNMESNSIFCRDKNVRYALNLAVDKNKIIKEVLGGFGSEAKGPFPPSMISNKSLKGFSCNKSKAKEILSKSGVYNSQNKLKILVRKNDTSSEFFKITNCILEDLKDVGINYVLVEVPACDYLDLNNILKCDMAISRWCADSGDADNFLEPLFNIDNVSNICRYNNDEVTEKLELAKKLINPEKRKNLYEEIQDIIVEDAPWIFLYHPKLMLACRQNVLGVKPNPLGLFKYEDIIKN
ncbi:chemotaxis protein [Clostridium botulinum]|nr:chemotaxis protein [Clostridium botulinum]